jgi:hypothetical protein
MAERQQVFGQVARRGLVIDAYGRHPFRWVTRGHRHRHHPGALHFGQYALGLAQRRRQDQAVDAGLQQLAQRRRRHLGLAATLDQHLRAGAAALVERAEHEFAQVPGRRIVVQHPDAARHRAGKTTRRGTGGVVERADRRMHQLARLRLDVALAVDDARHRHRRDADVRRYVAYRYALIRLSPLPFGRHRISLRSWYRWKNQPGNRSWCCCGVRS